MAFTILYLLWRYNDVIDGLSDFEGGEAWDFLPGRLQEFVVVLVGLYCSCLMLKLKYGNFDRQTSPKLLYSASVFAFEPPTGCNLDDLLGERDVGVQTYNPHAFRETSELKKRHSLRMRRLNKQARDLRKMLAFQWKDAKKNLDEKNELLLELQQTLIPLEKETVDNLLEKDIIDGKFKEEQRRYADMMGRIDKVNRQLEAVSVCPENLRKDRVKNQHGICGNEALIVGEGFCQRDAAMATEAAEEETKVERYAAEKHMQIHDSNSSASTDESSAATITLDRNAVNSSVASTAATVKPSVARKDGVTEAAVAGVEIPDPGYTRMVENKVHERMPVNSRADEITEKAQAVFQTNNASVNDVLVNNISEGDLQMSRQPEGPRQTFDGHLPRPESDIIENDAEASGVENATPNGYTPATMDSKQVSNQNDPTSPKGLIEASDSYQNQPVSEVLDGATSREEQSGPSVDMTVALNHVSINDHETDESAGATGCEIEPGVDSYTPEQIENIDEGARTNLSERSNEVSQLSKPNKKSVKAKQEVENEQTQNMTANRYINANRNAHMANQFHQHGFAMGGWLEMRFPNGLQIPTYHPQDGFQRVQTESQQARYQWQRGAEGSQEQDWSPFTWNGYPQEQDWSSFTWDGYPQEQDWSSFTWDGYPEQPESFQRGPGWHNRYSGGNRWR